MDKKINKEESEIILSNMLDLEIKEMARAYYKQDKKLYLVGGAVRDALLFIQPKDLDFCTDATPEESKSILMNCQVVERVDLVGEHFAVLMVYLKNRTHALEIASFRKDVSYAEGDRHPIVETGCGVTIEDDVLRRDFTINAMYYDIRNNEIIDNVYGIADLFHGIIRTVGEPFHRFQEDPLRKLRCLRFSSRFDFHIHDKTWKAIVSDPSLPISRDRIFAELKMSYDRATDKHLLLQNLNLSGLLRSIFDNCRIPKSFFEYNSRELGTFNLFCAEILDLESDDLKKLIEINKFDSVTVKSIELLKKLEYGKYDGSNMTQFWQARRSCNLTDEEILIYNDNSIEIEAILRLRFDPNVSNEVMSEGFDGRDIGIEINKRYHEEYKNMLHELGVIQSQFKVTK